jgi:hypothetical protein
MKTQKRARRRMGKTRRTKKGGKGSSSNRKNLKAAKKTAKKNYDEAKWCGDRTKEELKQEYDNIKFRPFNRKKIKILEGCYKNILKKEEMGLAQGLINEAKTKRINIEQLEEDPSIHISLQKKVNSPTRSISYSKLSKGSFEKVSSPRRREARIRNKMNEGIKAIENPQKRFTTEYGKEFNYLYGKKPEERRNSSGYNKLKRSEDPISLRLKDPEESEKKSSYLKLSNDSSIDLDQFNPAK